MTVAVQESWFLLKPFVIHYQKETWHIRLCIQIASYSLVLPLLTYTCMAHLPHLPFPPPLPTSPPHLCTTPPSFLCTSRFFTEGICCCFCLLDTLPNICVTKALSVVSRWSSHVWMCFSVGVPKTPLMFDIWPQCCFVLYTKLPLVTIVFSVVQKKLDDKQKNNQLLWLPWSHCVTWSSVVLLAPLSPLPYYWQLTILAMCSH